MANGGSEQTVGTTAAAEARMAQETTAVTRVSLWGGGGGGGGGGGEYEVIEWLTPLPPPSYSLFEAAEEPFPFNFAILANLTQLASPEIQIFNHLK